jgi:hypothetical protein
MSFHTIKNLSIEEIAALRHSLNLIDIKGSSAQFIATLQQKLDNTLATINSEESKINPNGELVKSKS